MRLEHRNSNFSLFCQDLNKNKTAGEKQKQRISNPAIFVPLLIYTEVIKKKFEQQIKVQTVLPSEKNTPNLIPPKKINQKKNI